MNGVDSDGTPLEVGDRMICLCCGARGIHRLGADWNYEGSAWVKDERDPGSSFDGIMQRAILLAKVSMRDA